VNKSHAIIKRTKRFESCAGKGATSNIAHTSELLYAFALLDVCDRHTEGLTATFIFERLCQLLCPLKREPEYRLRLEKAPTQTEFIPGSLNRNPYSSKDLVCTRDSRCGVNARNGAARRRMGNAIHIGTPSHQSRSRGFHVTAFWPSAHSSCLTWPRRRAAR